MVPSSSVLHKKRVYVILMCVQCDCAFNLYTGAILSVLFEYHPNKIAGSILLHEESCCRYPIPSSVLSFNRSDLIGSSIEFKL